jgi:hypothetical protein
VSTRVQSAGAPGRALAAIRASLLDVGRFLARLWSRWFPGDPGTPTPEERELWESLEPGGGGLFLRTATTVDTGGWSGPRRVCVVTRGSTDFLAFAPGPRPFARVIVREEVRLPQYHHGITELLLGVPGLPGLRIPLATSHAFLAQLNLQPAQP